MLVQEKDIVSYIPHRPPFVMVSNLLRADTGGFETDFYIDPNNIFIENGMLTSPALIENIAQTCALAMGYLNSGPDASPQIGFIGAVSKLVVHELPEQATTIHTRAEVVEQLQNVFLIKGKNIWNERVLLECEMKIVVATPDQEN